MAQQLYFSRDTRMFIQFRNPADNTEAAANLGKGELWEVPVLDGYSFSQTTNTSEITLAEMESTAGISRRGRRMFTDSLAPAEWSFSTYIRPFVSKAGSATPAGTKAASDATETHAVEECLWAAMFGADTYTTGSGFTRATNPAVSGGPVITPASATSVISIAESNRAAMTGFTLFFLVDTATANPLLYRMPEAVVNEVSVDFDVDGIATLNWSGFAKEIQDHSGSVIINSVRPTVGNATKDGTTMVVGDVFIDTANAAGRAIHLVKSLPGSGQLGTANVTQAIDEGTTSTKNFIRNRLTSVDIEAADNSDKTPTIFPGNSVSITGLTKANPAVASATAHGFKVGDVVFVTGTCAITAGGTDVLQNIAHTVTAVATNTFTIGALNTSAASGTFSASNLVACNGKYSLVLTGGSFTLGNNVTYLVPEELGAINKPLEHVTGNRAATGNATCYLTLEDADITNGTSRQFFNDLVGTGAMSKVVNKFKVTMDIGGSTAATSGSNEPALKIAFPTAHIEVPTHSVEDVISLETNFTALPTDFGTADEVSAITYFPVDDYA